VYAIVRAGGQQHKVAVGDTLRVDRVAASPGDTVNLTAVLLVDDAGTPTIDPAALGKAKVTAEVVEHGNGPKIVLHKFRNKTGYHKRQGHRQRLSTLRVTGIDTGAAKAAKKAASPAESPAADATETETSE
jgi:large subunit ribosomal protein L21